MREILRVHKPAPSLLPTTKQMRCLSDRVAVMTLSNGAGTIAQYDTPENVYSNPNCKQVARLTGTAWFLDGTAHGKQVETPLGTLPLKEPAEGVGTVLVRPEDLKQKSL